MPKSVPMIQASPLERIRFMYEVSQNYLLPLERFMQTYDEIFQFRLNGEEPVFSVFLPEHVQDVLIKNARSIIKGGDYTSETHGLARLMGRGLVTSEGEFWKRQRKMAAPAFHAQRVRNYAQTMVHYATANVDQWQDGSQLDIAREMNHITLDIISWTLMHDIERHQAETFVEALERLQKLFVYENFLPQWITQPYWRLRGVKMTHVIDDIVYPIIEQRRANLEDKGDLISMLMLAEDADGNRMSDREVRDEIVTLMLAGHETTANTLNWVLYALSQNPDIEKKLHTELDTVLQGREPGLADLPNLPYTQMVIKEAMRLLPPVPGISRVTLEDIAVGDYVIPARRMLFVQTYLTHRHPKVWDNPLEFIPERFSPENEAKQHKWAYYPFGGGTRVCIGNSFAMMEAQLLLATIASQFSLRLAPNAKVVPQPAITMYPRYGLPMIATRRAPRLQKSTERAEEMAFAH